MIKGVSQEGKKFCVLHESGNKMQLDLGLGVGVVGTVSPSVGSVGGQGTKPLENLQYLA